MAWPSTPPWHWYAAYAFLAAFGFSLIGVSLYYDAHNVQCDQPLNAMHASYGVLVLVFSVICVARLRVPTLRTDSAGLWFLSLGAGSMLVWTLLANVFLFSSVTCEETSKGVSMHPIFSNLYKQMFVLVLYMDFYSLVLIVGFSYTFHKSSQRRREQPSLTRAQSFVRTYHDSVSLEHHYEHPQGEHPQGDEEERQSLIKPSTHHE